MNKFIAKIFKSANVNAKVSKDPQNPRFKVVDNKLTLEGIIKIANINAGIPMIIFIWSNTVADENAASVWPDGNE